MELSDSLEDDLLAQLEEEEEEAEDVGGERAERAFIMTGEQSKLMTTGEDALLRIASFLAAKQLCTLAMSSHFGNAVGSRDSIWKSLYFERWPDPGGHRLEKSAFTRGWKRVSRRFSPSHHVMPIFAGIGCSTEVFG